MEDGFVLIVLFILLLSVVLHIPNANNSTHETYNKYNGFIIQPLLLSFIVVFFLSSVLLLWIEFVHLRYVTFSLAIIITFVSILCPRCNPWSLHIEIITAHSISVQRES